MPRHQQQQQPAEAMPRHQQQQQPAEASSSSSSNIVLTVAILVRLPVSVEFAAMASVEQQLAIVLEPRALAQITAAQRYDTTKLLAKQPTLGRELINSRFHCAKPANNQFPAQLRLFCKQRP